METMGLSKTILRFFFLIVLQEVLKDRCLLLKLNMYIIILFIFSGEGQKSSTPFLTLE